MIFNLQFHVKVTASSRPSSRVLASSAGGPWFNPQSRTVSYQRRYKTVPVVPLAMNIQKGKYWLFLKIKDRKINVMDTIWDHQRKHVTTTGKAAQRVNLVE